MNGTRRNTATGTRRKMSAAVRVSCFRSRLHRHDCCVQGSSTTLCQLQVRPLGGAHSIAP